MSDEQNKEPVQIENSETVIPPTLKDEFNEFQDVPREAFETPKFASPAEVVKNTMQKSNVIAESVEEDEKTIMAKIETDLDEALTLDSGLNPFLEQLNITRKQFYIFLSFVIILIGAVIVSFVFLFRFFGTSEEQVRVIGIQQPQIEVPVTLDEQEEEKFGLFERFNNLFNRESNVNEAEEVEEVTDPDDSLLEELVEAEEVAPEGVLIPATDVGRTPEVNFDSSAINATIRLGIADLRENRLSFYLRTYRQVRNIFNTDLYSYLARVPDRSEGFNVFLLQFKGANEQAKLAYEELRQEIADLESRVNRLRQEATNVENRFFDSLDNLESEFIEERLRSFQEVSARRDLAISELKARQAIAAIYARALPLIETKITAIELNRDPFVAGVRVVDFRQVDLDLIIRQR